MMQMKRVDIAARERAAMASPDPPEPSAKEVLMPVDPNASVRISAFNWVPPFAQGQVRDLRPRWALAEAGIAYDVRKLDAMAERPADYYQEQPSVRCRATVTTPSRCSRVARSCYISAAPARRCCLPIQLPGRARRHG